MPIPKEAHDAAFPAAERVGGLTVRPFNLQHVFALQRLAHPLMDGKAEAALSFEDQLVVICILSMEPVELAGLLAGGADRPVFLRAAYAAAAEIPVAELGRLVDVVRTQIQRGVSTFVPMDRTDGGSEGRPFTENVDHWGWPIVAADFLMHEYAAYDFDSALVEPLVRIFALWAVAAVRNGMKARAPSYGERALLERMTAAGTPAIGRMKITRKKRSGRQ